MKRVLTLFATTLLVAGCAGSVSPSSDLPSVEPTVSESTQPQTPTPQPSPDSSEPVPSDSREPAAAVGVTDLEVCEYVGYFYSDIIESGDSGSIEYRMAAEEMRELAEGVESLVMERTLRDLADAADVNAEWYAAYEADPDSYDIFTDGFFFPHEAPDAALDSDFYVECTAVGYE